MVRDAAMRRASTTLARTVVRQKYAAGIAYVQAQREQGVYQAFLGWMLEVQNTYVDYDKRTTSAGTAAAKNTFRDSTGAAIAAMRQHLLTATAAYQAARSTAISQKTAALAAANSSSDAQAKSVATLSAWDAYVRAMVAAQRNALKDRSASLPEASDALAAAHAEFEHETEPAGPTTNGPEPTDWPEATPAP
jgi:hypothetical protein